MELKKFKFPRKMAVVNMAAVQMKGKSKSYTIDPNFLFQRLLSSIILRREDIDVGTVFSHELCPFLHNYLQQKNFYSQLTLSLSWLRVFQL